MRAARTYERQLSTLGSYGIPLWSPGELSVGDVGYIAEDGALFPFSNVLRPEHDPMTNDGVPEGFTPFALNDDTERTQKDYITEHTILSRSVEQSSGISLAPGSRIEYTDSPGARLEIGHHADRTYIPASTSLRDFILQNVSNWFRFITDPQRDVGISLSEIVFVRGVIKTAQTEDTYMTPERKNGPFTTAMDSSSPGGDLTQCIFINCYKLKARPGGMFDPEKGEDDDSTTADIGQENSIEIERDSEFIGKPYNPVDLLLDYILAKACYGTFKSDADVAIAHDEEINQLCKLHSCAITDSNIQDFPRKYQPEVTVCGGVGALTLLVPNPIAQ
ncbi:hypothetical protein WOLCODRAFT_17343 [Wolfiporia cocos MD-104 SS10]|uniref:Uncharacterized protein n=1 Tax=Wolfiporia cocos (strain MD-104) TaxID=742152 RepID=A0A2H3JIW6_WOLCO|nr:hypothetical protein WOLCODRAFT_17343 [Wolfiporia cocos MD-104 SS10]